MNVFLGHSLNFGQFHLEYPCKVYSYKKNRINQNKNDKSSISLEIALPPMSFNIVRSRVKLNFDR